MSGVGPMQMYVSLNAEEADYITGATASIRVIEPRALTDGTFVLNADMMNMIDFAPWHDFLAALPQLTQAQVDARLPADDA